MFLLALMLLLLCTIGPAILVGFLTDSVLWGFVTLLVICIVGTIWYNRKSPHERMDEMLRDLAPPGFRKDQNNDH